MTFSGIHEGISSYHEFHREFGELENNAKSIFKHFFWIFSRSSFQISCEKSLKGSLAIYSKVPPSSFSKIPPWIFFGISYYNFFLSVFRDFPKEFSRTPLRSSSEFLLGVLSEFISGVRKSHHSFFENFCRSVSKLSFRKYYYTLRLVFRHNLKFTRIP